MAMIVTDTATAVITTDVQTATAPLLFTFSGTRSESLRPPNIVIWARSDTADYAPVYTRSGYGRFRVSFANADNYYAVIETYGASVDLAAVVVS